MLFCMFEKKEVKTNICKSGFGIVNILRTATYCHCVHKAAKFLLREIINSNRSVTMLDIAFITAPFHCTDPVFCEFITRMRAT